MPKTLALGIIAARYEVCAHMWDSCLPISLPPSSGRRGGGNKGGKGRQVYVRVSLSEIADDYPAPEVRDGGTAVLLIMHVRSRVLLFC